MLNKVKGNMYDFLNDYPVKGANRGYTWNPIKGRCKHDCVYCFMKRWGKPLPDLRLDRQEMETDLGKDNFIFVGSSTDMFAKNVDFNDRQRVIIKCRDFPENKYLFQTKNPHNMEFHDFPNDTVLATTLETNRYIYNSKAPYPSIRAWGLEAIKLPKMVTIEPIMQFDLIPFAEMIRRCNPEWVNIGADSTNGRKYSLPEPTWTQIEDLIAELRKFTEVKLKKNLNRLNN